MNEDPTRAMPAQTDPRLPSHGRVGPADPTADPATNPGMLPVSLPPESPTVPGPGLPVPDLSAGKGQPAVPHTRTAGLWVGVIASGVLLLFLLIFILQNNVSVQINFLGASGTLPTGVALLFAALAGMLLVAIPSGLRILQLRRVIRRGGPRPPR